MGNETRVKQEISEIGKATERKKERWEAKASENDGVKGKSRITWQTERPKASTEASASGTSYTMT